MLVKLSLALSCVTFASFVGGMLLANRELIPPTTGMALYVLGGVLGLFSAVLAVFVIVKADNYPVAMLGFLGLLPLLAVAAPAVQSMPYPMINDISTDLQDPPGFTHAPTLPANQNRNMGFPEANAALIREGYPPLHPVQTTKSFAETFELARRVAEGMPNWEVTHADEGAGIIEAVAVTRMFRWRDDVVIRVRALPDGGAIVDMRSKSREGKGDLGANAARIRQFMDKLTANIVAGS